LDVMVKIPVVIPRLDPLVVSVVVPVPANRSMVSVPLAFSAFVAIVYVVPVPPVPWSKARLANSWGRLPNVIVLLDDALKLIGAAKFHEAEVELLVHAPATVHAPPPEEVMYAGPVPPTVRPPLSVTVDVPAMRCTVVEPPDLATPSAP